MFQKCVETRQELQGVTNVPYMSISLSEGYRFSDDAPTNRFCSVCPHAQKDGMRTHLYGLNEAYRWGALSFATAPWR